MPRGIKVIPVGSYLPVLALISDNKLLNSNLFYKYVKNGQYTDNDIVYFDWKGILIYHWDWDIDVDGNVIYGPSVYDIKIRK